MTLISYQEVLNAISSQSPDLLIGNGFSIGFDEIFSYTNLKDRICNSNYNEEGNLDELFEQYSPYGNVEEIFKELKAIQDYYHAWSVVDYTYAYMNFDREANALLDAFIYSLLTNHKKFSSIDYLKIESAAKFISKYQTVFSLNFDLLIYYVINRAREKSIVFFNDGFGMNHWDPYGDLIFNNNFNQKNIFYLHGSLMLFKSESGDVLKVKRKKEESIIQQLNIHLENDLRPYIICAGSAHEKIKQLKATRYGRTGFNSLSKIHGPLVLFGCSMSHQDLHLMWALKHNDNIKDIYIGIYSDNDFPNIEEYCEMINNHRIRGYKNKLNFKFYDSKTVNPWGYT